MASNSPFICHLRVRDAIEARQRILLLKTDPANNRFHLWCDDKVDVTAELNTSTGAFSCTCAYFKLHQNPCKHLYWLAMRFFHVPKPDATRCVRWDEFLATAPAPSVIPDLTADRKKELVDSLKEMAKVLSTKFRAPAVEPRIDEDSICSICLLPIISATMPSPRIHWCRSVCGQPIHERCGSQLRDSNCPNCRTPGFYINKKRYRSRSVASDSD